MGIFVGKLSPRSTQCTPLHRALISKFSLKIAEFFAVFSPKFRKICENFAEFSPNVTNFFRDFSKMQHFSWNILEKLPIFSEKTGFSGHETAKKVIVSITYRASCSRALRSLAIKDWIELFI